MKKAYLKAAPLSVLAALLVAIGVLCGAIYDVATTPQVYSDISRQAVAKMLGLTPDMSSHEEGQFYPQEEVAAYIGLTQTQQEWISGEIVRYFVDDAAELPDVFNERERLHMQDVRTLIRLSRYVFIMCMTAALALTCAVAVMLAFYRHRISAFLGGTILGIAACGGLGVAAVSRLEGGAFADAFEQMHRLLFRNDLWLLNPSTDLLIRMMPLPYFEILFERVLRYTLRNGAIALALLALTYAALGESIRRRRKKSN